MFRTNERHTPLFEKKGCYIMERTYVFNFAFKVLAFFGIAAIMCVAGLSDGEVLSTAEVFIYGLLAFLAASTGIWGAYNCTKAIETEKRRRKRELARLRRAAAFKTAA